MHALQADAETSHHFVENEYGSDAGAAVAQRLQERFARINQIHIAGDGFDDNGGEFVGIFIQRLVEGFDIVIGQHQRVCGHVGRHTARRRVAESQ